MTNYPCRHGHHDCSHVRGGECSNEVRASLEREAQNAACRAALRELVERADTTELADGSSLDTLAAHAALGDFTVTHLTMTGYGAGTPFCGCDKAARREAGDTFAHVPYTNAEAFLARPEICPACKAEWDAAGSEE